jgi:hypothetical protein
LEPDGVGQGHDRTLQLLVDCGPIIYAAGPANATSPVNNPDAGADSGVPSGRLRHASLYAMPSCLEIRRHNGLGAFAVLFGMAESKLIYHCDKTRLTHEWSGPLLKADEVESNAAGENEYPCPMCGGRHALSLAQ